MEIYAATQPIYHNAPPLMRGLMAVSIDQFGRSLVTSGLFAAEELKAFWGRKGDILLFLDVCRASR